ncbi:hypothetical protein FQN60_009463 [Etheostoma spectabile]|uniref:Uncharacterized protein n=1 Tax=Etheostoma spectabile TaxID=54343 RepID=A0A5J5DJ00_9PERO|nr:hypothetical protein FQN60_009463 [Etheostoma spectabile]
MGRPKSSRYCKQPLLNNLSASIALSFIASGFFMVRGGLWLTNRKLAPDLSRNNEQ